MIIGGNQIVSLESASRAGIPQLRYPRSLTVTLHWTWAKPGKGRASRLFYALPGPRSTPIDCYVVGLFATQKSLNYPSFRVDLIYFEDAMDATSREEVERLCIVVQDHLASLLECAIPHIPYDRVDCGKWSYVPPTRP